MKGKAIFNIIIMAFTVYFNVNYVYSFFRGGSLLGGGIIFGVIFPLLVFLCFIALFTSIRFLTLLPGDARKIRYRKMVNTQFTAAIFGVISLATSYASSGLLPSSFTYGLSEGAGYLFLVTGYFLRYVVALILIWSFFRKPQPNGGEA